MSNSIRSMIEEIESGKNIIDVMEDWKKSIRWYDRLAWWFFGIPWIDKQMRKLEKWTKDYEAKRA